MMVFEDATTLDTFGALCYVTISIKGSPPVNRNYTSIIETINFEIGSKPVTFAAILNNCGRLPISTPQGDTTVTMDLYPIDNGLSANGIFNLTSVNVTSGSGGSSIRYNDNSASDLRIVILWTNYRSSFFLNAYGLVPGTDGNGNKFRHMRIIMEGCRLTDPGKFIQDKGLLKCTARFSCPAFPLVPTIGYNNTRIGNIRYESTPGDGSSLESLGDYT